MKLHLNDDIVYGNVYGNVITSEESPSDCRFGFGEAMGKGAGMPLPNVTRLACS